MKKKFVYVLFACLAMVNMALGQQNRVPLGLKSGSTRGRSEFGIDL